ncbi:MAG: glutamine synthetase beta-grasp domain-containing protein [Proteobacteria bacterium]|nr:glutamine synthetase beta-grasp domain-containing protein [Pseudomonadota bacterium]
MAIKAEYIWVDGAEPVKTLRSKTKILADGTTDYPDWGFDGSSTNQAEGHASDCILKPVFSCPDPIRGNPHVLVLCEVYDAEGNAHSTNTRAPLREVAERHAAHEAWYGIEQEYVMFEDNRPLGWPISGYPAPQGPFYCGVGADEVFGREIAEEHMDACLEAGLKLSGINAEVMPGQWEFQIGPAGPLEVGDHMVVARWLLYRIGEDYGVTMTLDPKPVRGDWNGSGAHTNFSTKAMREEGGMEAILASMPKFEARADIHIANYGPGIEQRLTGLHETCSYKEFRYGVGHRGASIRIPLQVAQAGKGYLEDRRPNSNIDPYVVARLMLETVCD